MDVLQAELERISRLPKEYMDEMGKKAMAFILDKKNPEAQCEKLISLIGQIEYEEI